MKRIAGKNLVLIGFMGTGKTEVGRLLAAALNRRLADTDQLVTEREGMPIREIFRRFGETYFRAQEKAAARELAGQRGLVISSGGGIVLDGENVAALRQSGFLVWLDADYHAVAERLAGDTTRPLLSGLKDKNAEILRLYQEREPLYRQAADVRINTTGKSPLAVTEEILGVLH